MCQILTYGFNNTIDCFILCNWLSLTLSVLWFFGFQEHWLKWKVSFADTRCCALVSNQESSWLGLLTQKQQVRSQEGRFTWLGAKSLFPSGQEAWKPVHMVRKTDSRKRSVFSFILKWGHVCLSEDRETIFEPEGWLKETVFLYSLKGYPWSRGPTETTLHI